MHATLKLGAIAACIAQVKGRNIQSQGYTHCVVFIAGTLGCGKG